MTVISGKGISANGSSLLHKTGRKRAYELTKEELEQLVTKEQTRRTIQRAIGRLNRMVKDDKNRSGSRRVRTKAPEVLENLGLSEVSCVALRLKNPGLDDLAIIALMRQKGLA